MKFNKKNKSIFGVVAILLAVLAGMIWVGFNFGAGSYPFVERYKINSDQENIISAVNTFFDTNGEYRLPEESYLSSLQCQISGYWYHIYFYFPDENRYLYTWIRESNSHKETTIFALVAVSKNSEPGNWLRVNQDLPGKENRLVKQKFEKLILTPIKNILQEQEVE